MVSRFKSTDILDREKLEYDLRLVDNYMRSKGYLQARHGEPRIERRASSYRFPDPAVALDLVSRRIPA